MLENDTPRTNRRRRGTSPELKALTNWALKVTRNDGERGVYPLAIVSSTLSNLSPLMGEALYIRNQYGTTEIKPPVPNSKLGEFVSVSSSALGNIRLLLKADDILSGRISPEWLVPSSVYEYYPKMLERLWGALIPPEPYAPSEIPQDVVSLSVWRGESQFLISPSRTSFEYALLCSLEYQQTSDALAQHIAEVMPTALLPYCEPFLCTFGLSLDRDDRNERYF